MGEVEKKTKAREVEWSLDYLILQLHRCMLVSFGSTQTHTLSFFLFLVWLFCSLRAIGSFQCQDALSLPLGCALLMFRGEKESRKRREHSRLKRYITCHELGIKKKSGEGKVENKVELS